ncbi:MAG: hypothetical protein GW748_03310 [Alphaproteobacteria bacterium]|nr:hypothetical protein [Alphaproteobacteria bacterium]NCQ66753.1 hypothetical protein [Alphaproteobacteria bacterium]NCT07204.1 hypothetical protein [Alphaproteobacteria bacterium]
MKFLVVFFTFFFLSENNALAGLVNRGNEDAPSLKLRNRTTTSPNMTKVSSEKDQSHAARGTVQQGQVRSNGRQGQNQGQAVSTAYDKAEFAISVDTDMGDQDEGMTDNSFMVGEDGASNETDKMTGQSTYSTSASLTGARPISTSALNRAKAADALKKKLQAENKKKLQLQDVSGENVQGDPRQDIINKLVEASQDIEK